MADDQYVVRDDVDGSTAILKLVDIGSSKHAPAVVVVGSDGSEGMPGADVTADVLKVEGRFTGSGPKTASALIKTGPGFLHNINISCNDVAPTAGRVDIYDNTAGSGTLIYSAAWTTTWFAPVSVLKNCSFATGLYILITTSADVNVDVDYR